MTEHISEELKNAFESVGATDNGKRLSTITIGEEDHSLCEPMATIFAYLRSIIGPVFLYDYFQSGDPNDFFEVHFSLGKYTMVPIDLSEYPCTQEAPYVGICENQYYSYFAVRLDDQEPSDPKVYFIDHDDWDGTPPRDNDCCLSKFLSDLEIKKES